MSWWKRKPTPQTVVFAGLTDGGGGSCTGNPLDKPCNARVNILRVEGGMVIEVQCWKSDDRNHHTVARSKILTDDTVDQMGVTIQSLYVQCQLELKGK